MLKPPPPPLIQKLFRYRKVSVNTAQKDLPMIFFGTVKQGKIDRKWKMVTQHSEA